MKRSISIILLFAVLALALSSCVVGPENETFYGKLTRITSQSEYAGITATVQTVSDDGITLNSEFIYSTVSAGTKIEYSIQSLAVFELVDGEYKIPDEMIKTSVGSIVISDGKIVEQKGDAAPMDLSGIVMYPQFNFNEQIFKNVDNKDGSFEASVISPAVFLGSSIACSNMRVAVTYTDDAASELILTYTTSGGSSVRATYKYEK